MPQVDHRTLERMTIAAHDGMARMIRPCHTAVDGDAIFSRGFASGTGRSYDDHGALHRHRACSRTRNSRCSDDRDKSHAGSRERWYHRSSAATSGSFSTLRTARTPMTYLSTPRFLLSTSSSPLLSGRAYLEIGGKMPLSGIDLDEYGLLPFETAAMELRDPERMLSAFDRSGFPPIRMPSADPLEAIGPVDAG